MRKHIILSLLILFSLWELGATELSLSKRHPIKFYYKDYINLPIYDWPRTLLSFDVYFEDAIESEEELNLFNNKLKKSEPFQLSEIVREDGLIKSAKINFFAELPSGKDFDFTLFMRKATPCKIESPIRIIKGEESWLVSDGHFGVYIPYNSSVDGGVAPAPIISIQNQEHRIGNHKFYSGRKNIKKIQTSILEKGDLFVECAIKYIMDNNASYLAKIKLIQGYPFVILDEKMTNITKDDKAFVDMEWNGFNPTRRCGNWDRGKSIRNENGLPIDQPIYANWCQEDPHWTGMGWVEDVEKQMVYRLLPFGGNSTREQVPVYAFWESGENARELGVFVYDHNQWNDEQYGIWQPTSDLSVYFRYSEQKVYFKYPLSSGTRSTAITFNNITEHEPTINHFNKEIDELAKNGGADSSDEMNFRYSMFLHRHYALLNLNKVKDWVLCYSEESRHPQNIFQQNEAEAINPKTFYRQLTSSPLAYYMTGLNGFPGIHSISHRLVFSHWIKQYLSTYRQLSKQQLQTIDALFLLSAYVNTLESMNAIRTSLAGTANMAADGWAVSGQMSFLYPEHPMAKVWADFFEKTLEVYGIFYTRPDVQTYESLGGRWVESLGVYNWAFLRPTTATNVALIEYDGKNRFASEPMSKRGRWMVDMVTSPIKEHDACKRFYPPHGAHGGGRLVPCYSSVYQIADWLQNYDPIVSENLYWLGDIGPVVENKRCITDWIQVHKKQYPGVNKGTNPHLKSQKYTGHGIVLRAGVDTDEELSIHLNQVDKGPNYRWGNQGQGNSGGLYFYAKGKVYTGFENEVSGDHIQDNLDGVTNFGVMKNGSFCNIGMNELVAPLYDLDIVQMAELRSSEGKDSYAWPEYLSRSVMLVGTDYFLIYDQTGTNWRASSRFSWFINNKDSFPDIIFVGKKARHDHWSVMQTNNSKGFYRDAQGSLLTLVTHKTNSLKPANGKLTRPKLVNQESIYELVPNEVSSEHVIALKTGNSSDIIFRDGMELKYTTEKESFVGEAGVIRRMNDGTLQLALMKGTKIAADGLSIKLSTDGTAIAISNKGNECCGYFKGDGRARLTLDGVTDGVLYIDGLAQRGVDNVELPKGKHHIEYAKHPFPMPSSIAYTEYTTKGTIVHLNLHPSAKKVRIEILDNNQGKWKVVGITSASTYRLPVQSVEKVHVRAVSINGRKEAGFAQEYPIYNTGKVPHYPEGLRLHLFDGKVELSWGKVLGTQNYRVYRRKAGETEYKLVFEGLDNKYIDNPVGVVSSYPLPEINDNLKCDIKPFVLYEYVVTAVNGYGESSYSPVQNTDPSSWANWYPKAPLKFKRRTAFWMEPYVYQYMIPEVYYPY